jgi:arylsulfatase
MLIGKGLVVETQKKKYLIIFVLAFSLWLAGFPFAKYGFAKEAKKPNVVLMLADNLGYGDLSSYNGGIRGEMRTPNIDQLAAEGVRLTQFLVEPGCTPSRSALQTGRYSIRSGLSLVIAPGVDGGLAKDEYTLGEMFKSVGYATTYVGKWHLGPLAKSQPQNQGYDQWLLGFNGSTDSTLYAQSMKQIGMPKSAIEKSAPQVFEAKGPGKVTRVRPYNVEYRKQIEADIAKTSSEYIRKQAQTNEPFYLMIGWTRPHFPNETMDQFKGASKVNQYGDSVVELDHHTGSVLKAIKDAGIEDNTIVIWISDNGPTVTATSLNEIHAGDTGPFRGELGDAYEGSIRTAGMIKWPGKIKPTISNEMFSIHDFLPTLAKIVGAKLPGDRPIDGIDQSNFLLGKKIHSNRSDLLTFIGDRLVAVRWKQFRFYPMQIISARNNPARGGYLGIMQETAGFPQIYNIEADPKEKVDIAIESYGWTIAPYLKAIAKYQATLKEHPNPPAGNVAKF